MEFIAHTTANPDRSDWEPLRVHLEEVAALAGEFAAAFGAGEWGRLAGLWHDLGKYHPRFQQRLGDESIRQPHSGAGAALAWDKGEHGLLTWPIAGHHSGLANKANLRGRLKGDAVDELAGSRPNVPQDLLEESPPVAPPDIVADPARREMWIRFLFSALVDADRLCTERFCDGTRAAKRAGSAASIERLVGLLEEELARIASSLSAEARERPINQARAHIARACLEAAPLPPGLFALTVPTGGGKTLAAMRFALHHARAHGLRRVIVVIPFTSIIEQNARHYARIFGAENVVEHHSNLDVERRRRENGESVADWQDLAAENWDAPIVVTTTVQFFESLFTNHPSRARKLHNVARSVVVLDEVQSLPPELLHTILDGLGQLVAWYGCSIVLSTATPPALRARDGLPFGLQNVREIVDDPAGLARALRRVRYEWPELSDLDKRVDPDRVDALWSELAAEVAANDTVLVVVHRRADARLLAKLLEARVGTDSVLHLSALMCPAHRLNVLEEVRSRLNAHLPCRLVSTQLIEAGVDVDFPVVYRALGGLDSIVQAAGRCNREGRLGLGRVVVFRAPTMPPRGVPAKGFEAACVLLRAARAEGQPLEADDPETQDRFFRSLYTASDLDARGIQRLRCELQFEEVAKKFRMIEDGFTHTVIVPYKESCRLAGELAEALKRGDPRLRDRFRALQPYTVSVHKSAFERIERAGALMEICEGLHMLRPESAHHYGQKYGLVVGDDIGVMDPGALIK
jgi:CRISPR-associated endonuclease/helicase Cas3